MSLPLETLIKNKSIVVDNTKTAISRIAQSFKFDAIREYNQAYKELYHKEISASHFDELLGLTNAQLSAQTAILQLRAEIQNELDY